jgi:hypothetical protein
MQMYNLSNDNSTFDHSDAEYSSPALKSLLLRCPMPSSSHSQVDEISIRSGTGIPHQAIQPAQSDSTITHPHYFLSSYHTRSSHHPSSSPHNVPYIHIRKRHLNLLHHPQSPHKPPRSAKMGRPHQRASRRQRILGLPSRRLDESRIHDSRF